MRIGKVFTLTFDYSLTLTILHEFPITQDRPRRLDDCIAWTFNKTLCNWWGGVKGGHYISFIIAQSGLLKRQVQPHTLSVQNMLIIISCYWSYSIYPSLFLKISTFNIYNLSEFQSVWNILLFGNLCKSKFIRYLNIHTFFVRHISSVYTTFSL